MSSYTEPKEDKVVPGPCAFRTQGAEIEMMTPLLDPSATEGRAGVRITTLARCHDVARRAQRGGGGAKKEIGNLGSKVGGSNTELVSFGAL